MDFLKSMAIAATGLRAQAGRMRIISENIANADSVAPAAGAEPYRRQMASFKSEMDRTLDVHLVALGRIKTDPSEFRLKYEPGHPAADANGNVKYPNVNALVEMTDLREAQRSYEANLNMVTSTRKMLAQTLAILK